jgi:hypothetical protein
MEAAAAQRLAHPELNDLGADGAGNERKRHNERRRRRKQF